MDGPTDPFVRYLAAKKPLDDRCLNAHVWREMAGRLRPGTSDDPVRLAEVGAGIGTMIERLLERSVFEQAQYFALEPAPGYGEIAVARLEALAASRGWETAPRSNRDLVVSGPASRLEVQWHEASLEDETIGLPACDLVLAHAVLDLLDLQRALPRLLGLLRPGGLFYFSLTFDGLTQFLPPSDPRLDRAIVDAYHTSMDRRPGGSAGRRAGSHLLEALPRFGARLIAAGPSDWSVIPHDGTYPGDEAFFLHHILNMVARSVGETGLVDPSRLATWIDERRRQVDAGRLGFRAHQIDVLGQSPP